MIIRNTKKVDVHQRRRRKKMKSSEMTLNDLSNEILLMIFKELNNIEVLYFLEGINQQFKQIIHRSILINRLTFVQRNPFKFLDLISSDPMLSRFSLKILPQIGDQIEWIDVESSRMKDILCATSYPNLHGLGLYNINKESAQFLLKGKKFQLDCF